MENVHNASASLGLQVECVGAYRSEAKRQQDTVFWNTKFILAKIATICGHIQNFKMAA